MCARECFKGTVSWCRCVHARVSEATFPMKFRFFEWSPSFRLFEWMLPAMQGACVCACVRACLEAPRP